MSCRNVDDVQREEPIEGTLENMETRYLAKYRNIWYFDYTLPAHLCQFFKKKRIRHSVNTKDLKQARALRDKYRVLMVSASTVSDFIRQTLQQLKEVKLI